MKRRNAFRFTSTRLLVTVLFSIAALGLHGQAKLSIQGFLKKSDGAALPDGEYALKFRIYNVETGGAPIWEETQSTVDVTGGIYSAILGAVTPLNIAFNEPYFVSVTVGSGTEMVPRIQLTSAPYALSLIGQDNIFPSSGNVGIGAQTATEKLHVKNTSPLNGTAKILLEGPENGTAELNIKKSGSSLSGSLGYNAGSNTLRLLHAGGNLQLQASGAGNNIVLTPNSTGLVNIDGTLLVNKNVVARGGAPGPSGSDQNGFAFAGNGGDNDSGLYCLGDGQVSLFTNGVERLTLGYEVMNLAGGMRARGGEPGAGGANNNGYAFQTGGDNDSGMFSLGTNSVSLFADAAERMRLTVDDIYMYGLPNGAGVNVNIDGGGRLVKVGSSARYKQNIQPLVADFKRVLEIESKSYNYKNTPDKLDIGFIAEELDALGLQNLVLYNDYGQPDGVMYDRTVIYLIPILREQQQRIAALEQEKAQNTTYLSALQAENAAMRQMLNELRADVSALKTATSTSTGSGSDRK